MWYNKFENNLKLIKAIKLNNCTVKKSWTMVWLFLYNNLGSHRGLINFRLEECYEQTPCRDYIIYNHC